MEHRLMGTRARKRRRNKQARGQRDAEARFGPDRARVVHEFADRWTIRQFTTATDAWREGELMEHCLREDDRGPIDGTDDIQQGFSLRDPRNFPHLTAVHFPGGGDPFDTDDGRATLERLKTGARDALGHTYTAGHGNRDPAPEYLERIKEWHLTLPYATALWLEVPET